LGKIKEGGKKAPQPMVACKTPKKPNFDFCQTRQGGQIEEINNKMGG
jgi:hypothetical protein